MDGALDGMDQRRNRILLRGSDRLVPQLLPDSPARGPLAGGGHHRGLEHLPRESDAGHILPVDHRDDHSCSHLGVLGGPALDASLGGLGAMDASRVGRHVGRRGTTTTTTTTTETGDGKREGEGVSSSPSSSLLGVVGEVSADVFPLVSALPLSSTVSTESIAQRGPTPPITPSVHRLSESHHRHPSRGRPRIRSSSSGRHPARPVHPVLMSLRRRRAPVRRSRLIVRARGMILSPVHPRLTARRTPRTRPSPVIDSIRFDRRVIPFMHACIRNHSHVTRASTRSIDRSFRSRCVHSFMHECMNECMKECMNS